MALLDYEQAGKFRRELAEKMIFAHLPWPRAASPPAVGLPSASAAGWCRRTEPAWRRTGRRRVCPAGWASCRVASGAGKRIGPHPAYLGDAGNHAGLAAWRPSSTAEGVPTPMLVVSGRIEAYGMRRAVSGINLDGDQHRPEPALASADQLRPTVNGRPASLLLGRPARSEEGDLRRDGQPKVVTDRTRPVLSARAGSTPCRSGAAPTIVADARRAGGDAAGQAAALTPAPTRWAAASSICTAVGRCTASRTTRRSATCAASTSKVRGRDASIIPWTASALPDSSSVVCGSACCCRQAGKSWNRSFGPLLHARPARWRRIEIFPPAVRNWRK